MNTERIMRVIAEELGLEIGEEFEINNWSYNPYMFKESGLYDCEGDKDWETLRFLLQGFCSVKKLPWEPKGGDSYFTVDPYEIAGVRMEQYVGAPGDERVVKRGLAFRTHEEAVAKAKEMGIIGEDE